jgi:hypothetical protein
MQDYGSGCVIESIINKEFETVVAAASPMGMCVIERIVNKEFETMAAVASPMGIVLGNSSLCQ